MWHFPPMPGLKPGWNAGTTVSSFYDPMIAKLIVHGSSREAALAKMQAALGRTRLAGIETNLRWLRDVAQSTEFLSGKVSHPFAGNDRLSSAQHHGTFGWCGEHDTGLSGSHRTVEHRRPAFRADGRPSVPAGQSVARQSARTLPGWKSPPTGPTLEFNAGTRICLTGAGLCRDAGWQTR